MVDQHADDRKKKQEEAERSLLIESQIVLPLESMGGELSLERREGLKTMTLPELRHLGEKLQNTPTAQQALTAIVKAISDSRQARRAAEDKRLDDGNGPAKVEMGL